MVKILKGAEKKRWHALSYCRTKPVKDVSSASPISVILYLRIAKTLFDLQQGKLLGGYKDLIQFSFPPTALVEILVYL